MKNNLSENKYFDSFFFQQPVDAYQNTPALKRITQFFFDQVLTLAPPKPTDSVLSLGCANGRFEIKIAPQVKKVIGVDFSEMAISNARRMALQKGYKNVQFFKRDLHQKLPFPNNSFEKIYALGVFHHLKDQQTVLAESYRLLKPGGILYSLDPNQKGLLRQIGRTFFRRVYQTTHSPIEKDLDYQSLFLKGRHLGFKVENLAFADFLSSPVAFLWPKIPLFLIELLIAFDRIWCKIPFLNLYSSSFIIIFKKSYVGNH